VGLFDLFSRGKNAARRKAARAKELSGDLEGAVEAYLAGALPDEAARVLLLRADAERSVERRMAFCGLALEVAADADVRQRARARKALLGFDLLRGKGGSLLTSEILGVARELEEAGELERAADAFAMAGDTDGEVRALTSAGAIERLEERLKASEVAVKSDNERSGVLRKVTDLDRMAERRTALAMCDEWLAKHHDEKVAATAMAMRARLLRGPVVDLVVDGERMRFALGDEATIGRGDATIVVGAPAISRQHVRLFRGASGPMVEDLQTRNGTTLAGARLAASVAVGEGLQIKLGGEIPCKLTPAVATAAHGALVAVDIAGGRYFVALGPLVLFGWNVTSRREGAAAFVVLRTPDGASPPFLGEYQLAREVELCAGDAIATTRGERPRLQAPGDQPREEATS
jgi:hypothetical protein